MSETVSAEKGHRWFAAIYDRFSTGAENGAIGRRRAALLHDVRGDVLDLGAGTGANFPHFPEDARVVAVEPDPHMAKRAEPRLRPNIELRRAPAERLPFADGSFDVAVVTLVLCSVDDLPGSLGELRRVLRPGGELRFIEHVRASGMGGRLQALVQPVYGRLSGGCHLTRRTEQALADAGFRIERLERSSFRGLPLIVGVARKAAGA
jgi:ubiquinone/menaquinone biosynthesis C-methylase UbiE